ARRRAASAHGRWVHRPLALVRTVLPRRRDQPPSTLALSTDAAAPAAGGSQPRGAQEPIIVRMRSRHDPQSMPAPHARPTSRTVLAPRARTSRTWRSETPLHRQTSMAQSPAGRGAMILRLILIINTMRRAGWQACERRREPGARNSARTRRLHAVSGG